MILTEHISTFVREGKTGQPAMQQSVCRVLGMLNYNAHQHGLGMAIDFLVGCVDRNVCFSFLERYHESIFCSGTNRFEEHRSPTQRLQFHATNFDQCRLNAATASVAHYAYVAHAHEIFRNTRKFRTTNAGCSSSRTRGLYH